MSLLRSVAAIAITLCHFGASASESTVEIEGLFGYRFGEVINPDSDGITECLDNKVICWGINRDMAPVKYDVRIGINKDRRIFELAAIQSFKADEAEGCLSTASRLAKLVTRRHKVSFDRQESPASQPIKVAWSGETLGQPVVNISISCKESSIPGLVATSYILDVSAWNDNYAKP